MRSTPPRVLETVLAGVPALVRIPACIDAPPVVLWHGFGPPASEAALMHLLPLDELAAIKVYLGLPKFGARAPSDPEELSRAQARDLVVEVFAPVVMGAAAELPAVADAMVASGWRQPEQALDLFGFSAGGAAVLFALAEREVPVRRAVLLNASTGAAASVTAYERATGKIYAWSTSARAIARRSDPRARAADIARSPTPDLLILQGDRDALLVDAAEVLHAELAPEYARHADARLALRILNDLAHGVSDPRDQAAVRAEVVAWFGRD